MKIKIKIIHNRALIKSLIEYERDRGIKNGKGNGHQEKQENKKR